jgi:hypothetical protein
LKSGSFSKNEELTYVFNKCDDSKEITPLIDTLKDFWVKTGDTLSLQYTGAESNISRVTK